jgi:hypothetical protein
LHDTQIHAEILGHGRWAGEGRHVWDGLVDAYEEGLGRGPGFCVVRSGVVRKDEDFDPAWGERGEGKAGEVFRDVPVWIELSKWKAKAYQEIISLTLPPVITRLFLANIHRRHFQIALLTTMLVLELAGN